MKRFLALMLCTSAGASLGTAIAVSSSAVASSDNEARSDDSPATDDLNGGGDPLGAGSTDQLGTCFWVSDLEQFEDVMVIECETEQRVISGGCLSEGAGVEIEQSFAFEGSASGIPLNYMDSNEAWYNASGLSGWRCEFTGDAGSGNNNYVWALCCGS